MSVVVAIKENGKVMIGADSQCTRGGTRRTLSNPNNYKVWRVLDAENCLLAHVGLVREANIIKQCRFPLKLSMLKMLLLSLPKSSIAAWMVCAVTDVV